MTITIKEFSREFINCEPTPEYGNIWACGGFAADIDEPNVPKKITESVKAGLWKISDEYPPGKENTALIAREILQSPYAVIAVATKIPHKLGNLVVGYRYFWLESHEQEVDKVGTILYWWQTVADKPTFKFKGEQTTPLNYEATVVNKQYVIEAWSRAPEAAQIQQNIQDYPYILQTEKIFSPYGLHYLALYLQQKYGREITWAWNVPHLHQPQRFTLMYVSSDEAYSRLEKATYQWRRGLTESIPEELVVVKDEPPIPTQKKLEEDEWIPPKSPPEKTQETVTAEVNTPSHTPVKKGFSLNLITSPQRLYFYTIFGASAALIGWGVSQLLLIDLLYVFLPQGFSVIPDLVLLPLVAMSLAVAMIVAEIFLSNPTHPKANRKVLTPYVWGAIRLGLLVGLGASLLTGILYVLSTPAWLVRMLSWSVLGLFTGLGEGLSWRSRSIEGGTSKASQRISRSTIFGLIAGFTAALLLEKFRSTIQLQGWEDPLGFLLLGTLLGFTLSLASAPTYQVALRAGQGFEAIETGRKLQPDLRNPALRFVINPNPNDNKNIEEGLSIELPSKLKQPLLIGADETADIYIPYIHLKAAHLHIQRGQISLQCLAEGAVQVHATLLSPSSKLRTLRHNQILTFYHQNNPKKYYRLVFYDRFLDPQA